MSEMTLSQGLRHAKKLKGQLAELQSRASTCVSYKDGQKPAFSFGQTLEKLDKVRSDLIEVETRIAITNAMTKIDYPVGRLQGVTMTFMVRTLQELKGHMTWLRSLPVRAQENTTEDEYGYDEDGKRIRVHSSWKCDMPEAKRAERLEAIQADFDRLNDEVEKKNNVITLIKL